MIEWTKIKTDVNGNPRYVCHYLNLITDEEVSRSGANYLTPDRKYAMALERARKIGGRKFHNKQYGGGIVFQSYSLAETESAIHELLAKEA